jgi:hypothetical protein
MKAATINDLKQELSTLPQAELLALCIRLAKFKKENKELLNYLLFESHDTEGYITVIKNEIDEDFAGLPKANSYLTKKALRKILRLITKYARHTGSKQSEVEIRIHFCTKMKASRLQASSVAIGKIYKQQVIKINGLIDALHEDLHYDYKKQLERLG